jgi:glyoxylase-like metal-dependent hydrolase (beta-lactamase superfamily II)
VATPFSAPEQLTVLHQIARFGLKPADITHIVVSHFHADHVAGLCDFPSARFVCNRAAYNAVESLSGNAALRRAYLPSLLPEQFRERATLIEDYGDAPIPGLGNTFDLFEDGSIRLVQLPGHARGQIGALVEAGNARLLLAADGAWYRQAIRECRPPARVASLFVDDYQAVEDTLRNLHQFSAACPEVAIIPTHCPEAYQQYCL